MSVNTAQKTEVATIQEAQMSPPATLENATVGEIMINTNLLAQIDSLAERMATAKATIPDHLKGSVGDCWAVIMQAIQWKMNPFAVGQKTHLVHGTLGYEAQLVNAVITSIAPTKDRIHYEWFGEWENIIGNFVEKQGKNNSTYTAPGWNLADEKGLGIRVWATIKGEGEPRELELLLSQAQPRNSTLWATDPKQQLAYLAVKRWARLYCPDVMLGVYTPDELEPSPPAERDMGAAQVVTDDPVPQSRTKEVGSKLRRQKSSTEAPIEAEPVIEKGDVIAIRNALESAGITEAEFCTQARIDAIESLPLVRYAGAMDWINSFVNVDSGE